MPIKYTELRHGNYVKSSLFNEPLSIYDIYMLSKTGTEVEGIELSPEVLEGLGFHAAKGKQSIFHNKDNYQIAYGKVNSLFYIKTDFGYEYLCGHLCYVHQIQNLYYSLTGEELTFKQIEKENS
jgi:hypothetical protein